MPSTVDNRVVEMKFDNKQFEANAAQTIASLQKLNQSLQLQNAAKGFAGVTAAAKSVDVSSVSAGIRNINWALVSVMSVVQTVFRNITTAAMQAGQRIMQQFIKPIREGFSGYETKIGATAVLMSSTGKSIGEVSQALKELNEYSDKTIYSFEDMTQNITKFTNAGVKLEDAVEVMKGIGNWAAISGAGMQQAASVEYQLGQAMGSGVVRLQDWMSVQNASMDTSRFKKELLDVAVKMGTVKKGAKGMYYAISDTGKKLPFNETSKFRDSLEKQWLTTGVLTGALKNYASTQTSIGKEANAAAADVKTFTQMMATFGDSMKTSWIQSFEYIFGNKDEATKFWTSLSGAIGGVVGAMNASRNETLKLWKALGGRTAVIEGVKNIFNALGMVLRAIGSAFREVFPKKTAADFVKWSKDFLAFTKKLAPTTETLVTIRKVFLGIFSAIDLAFKTLKFAGAVVYTFVSTLLGGKEAIGGFGAAFKNILVTIADFFTNLNSSAEKTNYFAVTLDKIKLKLEEFATFMKTAFGNIAAFIVPMLGKVGAVLQRVGVFISNIILGISDAIVKAVALLDQAFPDIFRTLMLVFTGGGVLAFNKFLKNILDVANKGTGSIQQFFDGITGALSAMQTKLKADALKSIATAILMLAASMLIMSMIPAEKLAPVMAALTGLMLEVVAIMASFDKFGGGVKGIGKAAFALNLIAASMIGFAVALKILASIDPKSIAVGIGAIAGLLTTFVVFSRIVSKDAGLVAAGAALMLLASGLVVLSGAVKILGSMKVEELGRGMLAIGVLLATFAGFAKVVDPKGLVAAGVSLVAIAFAMTILAGAVRIFGTMSLEQLGIGLLGLVGALAAIVLAVNFVPASAIVGAAALVMVAFAITTIAVAMKAFAGMKWAELAKAMVGLGGTLLILTIALYAMSSPTLLIGAAAIVIVSGAFLILASAMKIIGGMSWGSIIKGLVALGGALVIIGVAGYLLTGAAVGLLSLGAALLMVGAGVFLAGAGIAALGVGLGMAVTAIATGGRVIIQFLIDISKAIPTILYNLARGVGAFMQGLVDNSAQLSKTFLAMFELLVTTLRAVMPKFFELVGIVLQGVLNIINTYAPQITLTFFNLLMMLLTTIQRFLPKIIDKAGNIIVAFINGMSRFYSKIITAGTNFIINLVKGIGDNMLKIVDAAAQTILKFINGLTAAVTKYGPQINSAMRGLIKAVFNAGMDAIGLYTFADIGGKLIAGIKKGIENAVDGPLKAIKKIIDAILGAARRAGIIKSPSRLFADGVGMPIVLGIAAGMISGTGDVVDAAGNVVKEAYSAMDAATSSAVDVFSNIQDPKITPVVDLSNVYKSANSISSLMGNRALGITGNVSASIGQNGSAPSTNAAGNLTNVSFQQNNYSPKPLSRLELYRQTQNQLRQLQLNS